MTRIAVPLPPDDAVAWLQCTDRAALGDLFASANRLREEHFADRISLCSIVNAKSGRCSEDCGFCAQSALSHAAIETFPLLDTDALVASARRGASMGASCHGIVAAWKRVAPGPDLDQVCNAIRRIRAEGTLAPDASLGIVDDPAVVEQLRLAGLAEYNHNLETSRAFFPRICTTHAYDDRLRTIRLFQEAGIRVCSGALFGLGESARDRVDLALELRNLAVHTIPLNFLHPIPGTPLGDRPMLSPIEALTIIAVYRHLLPDRNIKVAGGREAVLRDLQPMMFFAGASSTLIGHYLTTQGRSPEDDLRMIRDLGLTPVAKGARTGEPS